MSKAFYITTPIYYVNAKPHIGHAYTTIIADCLARYKRACGLPVYFLTGTDEHGEKIRKAAASVNKQPQEFVDEVMNNFRKLWDDTNVKYDYFVRTTDLAHKQAVTKAINYLQQKGDIYKAKYTSLYCVPCEGFLTETQVKDAGNACPDCKRPVEKIEEENYFFKMSKYNQWLKDFLKNNPDFVLPKTRYNEAVGFLENNPLTDMCISRPKSRVSWGVDFPLDPDYVVYVWFDALLNYFSAAKDNWPADIHLMAKDILKHHAIFWPVMLKALDLEMPKKVLAHGWWKVDQQKMSKSLGNVVDPYEIMAKIGVDGFRFFLLREITVGSDGNFSWDSMINRVNVDLANDLGNLVYRTLNMAEKYFNGQVQSDCPIPENLVNQVKALSKYHEFMNAVDFSFSLELVFDLIRAMNKYVEEVKPWNLSKQGQTEQLKQFIAVLLEGIRVVSYYLYPFIPKTAESITRQLGLSADFQLSNACWRNQVDFTIKKEAPLFPRIEVEKQ